MSLLDRTSGEQAEQLAVLYCDISQGGGAPSGPGSKSGADGHRADGRADSNRVDAAADQRSETAMWRVNYFRAAREMAADHGGHEATVAAGGWVATFDSTVEALICAQELSSLVGWQTGGPSLSGGLSAGDVVRDHFGICGHPVREAIALCRQARPRQVLVADPLKVVVARDTERSFAPAPPVALTPVTEGDTDGGRDATLPAAILGPDGLGRPRGGTVRHALARTGRREATSPMMSERPLRLLGGTDCQPTPAPCPVRLNILGWVQLEIGEPVVRRNVLHGSQTRAVTSMLALRRGPVHKDELAELLWPGSLPEYWDGALRGLISKVRRFLDAGGVPSRETLIGDGGHYELRLPPGVTIDRYDAKALIATATSSLADRRPVDAAISLRRAVTILERRLLSGPDNASFDQVRAELAHDRLAALELLARADLQTGDLDGARQAAGEALSLDPFRESVYRVMMEAHSAAGSRGEALRAYEQCRRMLADELGVLPAPQTQALYVTLLG